MTDESGFAQPDLEIPSAARMYDYYLGGANNFAADRELAERALASVPELRVAARHNRSYLRRVVTYLAERGVDQFLDIGSGIPTVGNVHEIARAANPRARVVYVDHDPVAVAHSEQLLGEDKQTTVVRADIRDPESILTAPRARALLDFTRPIGLLMVAVLHFVPDEVDPARLLAGFRRALVPGSYLAMSHFTLDSQPAHVRDTIGVYRDSADPLTARTRAEVTALLDGFEVLAPGVVWLSLWRPDGDGDREPPEHGLNYAGVGLIP